MVTDRYWTLHQISRAGAAVLLLVFFSIAAVSCAEPFTLEDLVDGSMDANMTGAGAGTLTISPPAADLYVDQLLSFDAYGGTGPYSFAVSVNNTSSPGMSGATYTAGPLPGTDTVTVTDSLGATSDALVTVTIVPVSATLAISPPLVDLYVEQSFTFVAYGGTATYTFEVSVNNTGAPVMAGAVYTAGLTPGTDMVTVTDSLGAIAVAQVIVTTLPLSISVDYTANAIVVTSTAPYQVGTAVDGSFTLNNIGTADGGYPVVYEVWASTNSVIGPQDYLVADGSTPLLAASGSTVVTFSAGSWPAVPDVYNLIVRVEADDDNNPPANNDSISSSQFTVVP